MRKTLRIIGLKLLILLLSIPLVKAQEDPLQKIISIKLQNVSFPSALEKMTAATGSGFSYNPDKIDKDARVSVQAENQAFYEVLTSILSSLELDYRVIENTIVIKQAKKKKLHEEPINRHFSLSGFVYDNSTGEVLIAAVVALPGTSTGTITNEYGFYSLLLPEGSHEIAYSYLGYSPVEKNISLHNDTRISLELDPEARQLEEVQIVAEVESDRIVKAQTSEMVMQSSAISDMPGFMGEPDVIKSLQTLPGIKFYGDGSTLFYVRGGNRDQNLILVDEAVIYNPAHLLGLFSSFSPGSINSLKIYKGDIPAEYGGRLSSLLDIKTKEGNKKKTGFSGNTGFFATSLNLEGPFSKNKSSYFLSVRRSQLKWLFAKSAPELEDLYFSDVNLKLNFRLNNHNRLLFSTYAGRDKYLNGNSNNSSGIQWENVATTLRLNHLFSEKLFSNTSITGSRYDYDFITSRQRSEMWNSHISNVALKSDFTWYRSPETTMKWGFLLGRHNYNPGNFESGVNPNTGVAKVPVRNTSEQALYFSSEQKVSDRISLRYGARLSGWGNLGEAIEVVYDADHVVVDTSFFPSGEKYNQYLILEPRFSMNLLLSEDFSLKTAYSRTSQFVNLLSNSISPFTSMEIWLPASLNIKPQIADQIVIGGMFLFGKSGYSLSVEGFYKKMLNQIEYSDHAQMLFNPFIEGELRFGTSKAKGIEVMLSKTSGLLTGWLAYTLSSTRMLIPEINEGREFPASYDRPHDLSVVMQYQIRPRWQVSANWILMTGGAYTAPVGYYYYNDYQLPLYDRKNNERMPVYHRLDVSTELQLNKPGARSEHKLKFSLFNAYGRKNPVAINYNKVVEDANTIYVPMNHAHLPELQNTMTYLFRAVPSFSYSFSF